MDNAKEQADRLERNITKNVAEQNAALLEAYFGPLPYPLSPKTGAASSSSSRAGPLDRKITLAKLTKGAELAAAKTPKAKAKDTERATAKEAAKAKFKKENAMIKISKKAKAQE